MSGLQMAQHQDKSDVCYAHVLSTILTHIFVHDRCHFLGFLLLLFCTVIYK